MNLFFYVPPGYGARDRKYPVLIHFHGGGYALGHPSDDARWADAVVTQTGAVVVSVEYRKTPGFRKCLTVSYKIDWWLEL
jgi:putative ergosteryl-3beta-O-L-aspartate hydrolase